MKTKLINHLQYLLLVDLEAKIKEFVDELLKNGNLSISVNQKILGYEAYSIVSPIREIFDCEVIDDGFNYLPPEPEPDEKTAKAIEWYESLPDEHKNHVKLLVRWWMPIAVG